MAFRQFVLTLNGAAQQLDSVFPAGELDRDPPLRTILLQARGTNSNPIHLGSDNLVSSTVFAIVIPTPTGGVPVAPFILGEHNEGPLKLSNFWVFGTDTEFLHIGIVPF